MSSVAGPFFRETPAGLSLLTARILWRLSASAVARWH